MDAIAKLAALTKKPGRNLARLVAEITSIEQACRHLGGPPITNAQKCQGLLRACKHDPNLRTMAINLGMEIPPKTYEEAVETLTKYEAVMLEGTACADPSTVDAPWQ